MIMTAVSTLYKMTTLSTFYKMTAAAVYKPSFSTPMIMFNQCQSEPTGQNLHPLLHVPPRCLLLSLPSYVQHQLEDHCIFYSKPLLAVVVKIGRQNLFWYSLVLVLAKFSISSASVKC